MLDKGPSRDSSPPASPKENNRRGSLTRQLRLERDLHAQLESRINAAAKKGGEVGLKNLGSVLVCDVDDVISAVVSAFTTHRSNEQHALTSALFVFDTDETE